MTDTYRATMFQAAAAAVVRAESLDAEGYAPSDLRLSWGGTTDEVAVSLVHAGTTRHWSVAIRDRLDRASRSVGVDFQVRPIAGFPS